MILKFNHFVNFKNQNLTTFVARFWGRLKRGVVAFPWRKLSKSQNRFS